VSAIVSVVVLALFVPGLFVACNEAGDEDGGGTPTVARPTATSQTPTVQPTPTPTVTRPTATSQTPTVQPTPTPTVVIQNVSADDDPFWGPADAPVTIIEFGDFQCPYCGQFATQTLPQIKQAYESNIRFVFRDFPLHENSEKAAEAADCANEQGKFWEYHDKLFSNQSALDVASLKSYASQLDLDSGAFNQCLDSNKYAQEVQKDEQDGGSYGVGGTPAFFINGELVSGALPFADFKAVIDAVLQGRQAGSAIPGAAGGG
jgi:protein-disulfide isomerase